MEPYSQPEENTSLMMPVPICEICGRQDESLRQVSFLFVYSLIIMTFRRTFSGVWCSRHRNRYWFLATAITSTVGWFGIPFGFILTPIALLGLVRGGYKPEKENARLLQSLAAHKEKTGDLTGARQCLEASLKFEDNSQVREKLIHLYHASISNQPGSSASGAFNMAFSFLALFFSAAFLSLIVGGLDYVLSFLLNPLLSGFETIFASIFSWVPLVLFGILALLILRLLLERVLTINKISNAPLALSLAAVTALAFSYGLLESRVIASFLQSVLSYAELESIGDAVLAAGAVFFRGGILGLKNAIAFYGLSGTIYLILVGGLGVLSLIAFHNVAAQVAAWQAGLGVVRDRLSVANLSSYAPGWLVVGSSLAIALLFVLFYPQKATVDYMEALEYRSMGYEAFNLNKYDEAVSNLENAIALRPSQKSILMDLGWVYLYAGRFDQALAEFQLLSEVDPDDPFPHLAIGQVYYQLQEYGKAEQEFLDLLQTNPDDIDALIGIGMVYQQQDRLEEGIQTYEKVLRLAPEALQALMGLGNIYIEQEDYTKSVVVYKEAIDLDDESSEAHEGLGRTYYYQDNLDLAEKELMRVTEIDPTNLSGQFHLALTYLWKGEYQKALTPLKTLVELEPQFYASHGFLALAYYHLDQATLMEQELQKALAAPEDDSTAWYALGVTFTDRLLFEKAEGSYLKAMQSLDEPDQACSLLADVYSAQKKFDQALQICEEALRAKPKSGKALIALSRVYIDMEDLESAIQELNAAEVIGPDNYRFHNVRSFIAFHQDDPVLARQEAEKAVKMNPYSDTAFVNLAFALQASGQQERAKEAAMKAVKLGPKNGVAHYILGMCYLDSSQTAEAKEELQKFLDLYWDRAYIREYRLKAESVLEALK